MKQWLIRCLLCLTVLVAAAVSLWYYFFGYTCRSFEPVFHERWSAEAREEWRHLDSLLRHDAGAASALMRETGLVDKEPSVTELAVNIAAMLELVKYAAENGELKVDEEYTECRVRKARLSHLLVVGGYLHLVEDLYDGGDVTALYSVPEISCFTQSSSLLVHLIHGPALARLREDILFTPLPERWELVKKLLSRCDELPTDVVQALGLLSAETKNPEYALYAAQHFDLSRTQKLVLLRCGLMMDNGLPLVQRMMESGCPTEYHYRNGDENWSLKNCSEKVVKGNDAREKLDYIRNIRR